MSRALVALRPSLVSHAEIHLTQLISLHAFLLPQPTGLCHGAGYPCSVVGCLQHRTNALGREHPSAQDLSD